MSAVRLHIEGDKATMAALRRLAEESPARARAAQNRTMGVVKSRVIKTVSRLTGIPRRILGGRQGRNTRAGRIKGTGYFKLSKATRTRRFAQLFGLVEGVPFRRLKRKSLRGSARKPGGLGEPFRATMPSGFNTLFERASPQTRISKTATPGTKRRNLPIREVTIPIWRHAIRAMRTHTLRAARTVFPGKIWEELQKSIKPVRR